FEPIVVHVSGRCVVGTGVALVSVAEPVVVHGDVRGHIVGPANTEGLVVVGEDVPGQGHIRRAVTDVHHPVPKTFEGDVVDPHVVRVVHPDAGVVVVLVLAVPVPGHVGVPDGHVADDVVVYFVVEESSADELGVVAGTDQGGVRGDLDHVAENFGFDGSFVLGGEVVFHLALLTQFFEGRCRDRVTTVTACGAVLALCFYGSEPFEFVGPLVGNLCCQWSGGRRCLRSGVGLCRMGEHGQ